MQSRSIRRSGLFLSVGGCGQIRESVDPGGWVIPSGFFSVRSEPNHAAFAVCWSRRLKAAQIVSRGLRPAGCREEGALVGLQQTNPGLDISAVAQIAVDRKHGA